MRRPEYVMPIHTPVIADGIRNRGQETPCPFSLEGEMLMRLDLTPPLLAHIAPPRRQSVMRKGTDAHMPVSMPNVVPLWLCRRINYARDHTMRVLCETISTRRPGPRVRTE